MEAKTPKALEDMTVQQLRTHIRQLTKEANKIRLETEGQQQMDKLYSDIMKRQDIQGSKGQFVGRLNYKSKTQLISQTLDLQRYIRADATSASAIAKQRKKARTAWKSFKSAHGNDITFKEYESLTNIYTSLSDLLDEFGSEQVKEINRVAAKKGISSSEVIKAMTDVVRESKGEGKTQYELAQDVYKKLGII